MTQNSRRLRGRRTEIVVAEYFSRIWENARAVNSGASGSDCLGTPFHIEIKARKDFNPLAWVKQNEKRDDGKLKFVVYRANGMGDSLEAVDNYLFIARLGDMMPLLEDKVPSDAIVRCKGCGTWTTEGRTCGVCEIISKRNN